MKRESLTFKCLLLMAEENRWSPTWKSPGPVTISYVQCFAGHLNADCMFPLAERIPVHGLKEV